MSSQSGIVGQREWLRKSILKLYDEADDANIKAKLLEQFDQLYKVHNVLKAQQAATAKALADFKESALRRELLCGSGLLCFQVDANTKKLADIEHSAVRRQVAINIEWELKMDYLQICLEERISHLRVGYGQRKGQLKDAEVAKLSVNAAKKLARKSGNLEALSAVDCRCFGDKPAA
ncbi:hypothetical protein HDU85_005651 [Gaertneriomyces sp. JEL0708]|nr:hypothetical protein HDU85_005651 [Gaertneriomyces sp. JEL0708]